MDAHSATVSLALYRVYRNLRGRLITPYQPDGVKWMLGREFKLDGPRGGIVADEMGLGKTISSLAIIIGNELPDPTLIVAPKTLVAQWARECEKFTGIKPYVIGASDACRLRPNDLDAARVVITSYHALLPKRAGPNALLLKVWGRIIVDEAHIIKKKSSRIRQQAMQLHAGIKWCLTGTPVTNKKSEFLTLLEFIGVSCSPRDSVNALRSEYVLRRTFEDLCSTCERLRLPPCFISECVLDLGEQERALYDSLCDEGRLYVRAYEALDVANTEGRAEGMRALVEVITRLRQVVVHPQLVYDGRKYEQHWSGESTRVQALIEMIRAQPAGSKALIFTHWNLEMQVIGDVLRCAGLNVLTMNGCTAHDERDEITRAFNTDPRVNALVIQIEVGGVGLNLQAATHVYINSLAWNATSELQAIARAHRIGVDHVVRVTRLVMQDTIDEYVLKKQQEKLSYAAETLGDDRIQDKLQLSLTISDFKTIFGDDQFE